MLLSPRKNALNSLFKEVGGFQGKHHGDLSEMSRQEHALVVQGKEILRGSRGCTDRRKKPTMTKGGGRKRGDLKIPCATRETPEPGP